MFKTNKMEIIEVEIEDKKRYGIWSRSSRVEHRSFKSGDWVQSPAGSLRIC